MRVLDRTALATEKGVNYSATQLWRRCKSGLFPKPIRIGNRNAWLESEVDAYLETRVAERDAVAA